MIEDGFRPTYSTTYRTNYLPLEPSRGSHGAHSGGGPALPNPARQPEGLLLTGNVPTRRS